MDSIKIEAQPRETGKKANRQVRQDGLVPCVLYGKNTDSLVFSIDRLEIRPLIYTNETHRVEITLDGETYDCILKDVDFHPVTDAARHADFQVLAAGEYITLTVPVRYEGTPVGQTDGGDTQYVLNEVEVRCLPKDIPSSIKVDVTELEIGDSLHVGQLDIEGVEFTSADRLTLVTVVPPRMEEIEEPGVALEGEEELVEEGEEAAEAAETEGEGEEVEA